MRSLYSLLETRYIRNIIITILLVIVAFYTINFQKITSNPYKYAQDQFNDIVIKNARETVKYDTLNKIDKIEAFTSKSTQPKPNSLPKSIENFADISGTSGVLTIYYKINCPRSQEFMGFNYNIFKGTINIVDNFSTWQMVKANLPDGLKYREVECNKEPKECIKSGVRLLPGIYLTINGSTKEYIGNFSYGDIGRFLREQGGFNLKNLRIPASNMQIPEPPTWNIWETFVDNSNNNSDRSTLGDQIDIPSYGKITDKSTIKYVNDTCPPVTFDKQFDPVNGKFKYQIFSPEGQYGYAVGGKDEPLTQFGAAYGTVDTYLSSLPNPDENKYASVLPIPEPDRMKLCAKVYQKEIGAFGLCDKSELDSISKYNPNMSRVPDTNYSGNTNVVNAIKAACGISK